MAKTVSTLQHPEQSMRKQDHSSILLLNNVGGDDGLVVEDKNLQAVDSADVDDPSQQSPSHKSLWRQLVSRMTPQNCLAPMTTSCSNPLIDNDDCPEFDRVLPPLFKQLKQQDGGGKPRNQALHRLFRLTDRERPCNRVPIVVHGTPMGMWEAISTCLDSNTAAGDRRLALLFLNNLCLPSENKAAILQSEPSEIILPPLLSIIEQRCSESYLAAVCLFNLSFYEKSKLTLLTYIPTSLGNDTVQNEYSYQRPADHPRSLLRTLESVIQEYTPIAVAQPLVHSVQAETVRWSMGVLRNLTTLRENAILLAQSTDVWRMAVQLINAWSKHDLALWKRDSLPDACLLLLTHLVQPDEALKAILGDDHVNDGSTNKEWITEQLKELTTRGGIHAMRAQAIVLRLDGKGSYEKIVLKK